MPPAVGSFCPLAAARMPHDAYTRPLLTPVPRQPQIQHTAPGGRGAAPAENRPSRVDLLARPALLGCAAAVCILALLPRLGERLIVHGFARPLAVIWTSVLATGLVCSLTLGFGVLYRLDKPDRLALGVWRASLRWTVLQWRILVVLAFTAIASALIV